MKMIDKYDLPAKFEQSLKEFKATKIQVAKDYERNLLVEGRVSCRKGCHHCCYYPVLTGLMEALSIYRSINQNRLWTVSLKKKFKETADRVRGLNIEVWILSQIPCPLLDEKSGTCIAYDSRPFSCRTVFSRSDPYNCVPSHSDGVPEVVPRKDVIQEMYRVESGLLRRHRLGHIILPLSVAVPLAERLDKGEIDFSICGSLIWKEYIQQW